MNHHTVYCNPRSRRGISLLEVLMSIFIISIGLLGVAAMLPLAQLLAKQGTTADRTAIAGRAAHREFHVRGMSNPGNWLRWDSTNNKWIGFSVDATGAADSLKPMQPLGAKAYCLDPRGAARNITSDFPNGASPSMPRITLGRWHPAPSTNPQMSKVLADEVFMFADDLEFNVPDDVEKPPLQNVFNPATGDKRLSRGQFSWLATIVREGPGDRYTLSVAVLQGRNNPAAGDEADVNATFLGSGFGGGDIRLTDDGDVNDSETAAIKAITIGHWIMLAKIVPASGGQPERRVFRWYRVIRSGEYDESTDSRELTVAGRDWDITVQPAYALVYKNTAVVGVHERTIRVENSSVW